MIRLKQFVFNPLQVNAWLIYEEEGNGILIDPSCMTRNECQEVSSFVETRHIGLKYILNTHGHFDHVFGVGALKTHPDIQYFIHQADVKLLVQAPDHARVFGMDIREKVPEPDGYLQDSQLIQCGRIELSVIHVPGHTRGGTALYAHEQGWLFTGDTLFAGSIGRTDLPGGETAQLLKSIRERLLALPDETLVYPGHGPSTTIGTEKRHNPFLQD